ncbi:hypothetical protein [Nonomuraea sp. NPDC049784]|uniref:hypothetical protein n=1 Tax=Nonomuraea sp. NPDC049784 TaxID=3154361 RepID=UPI0033E21EC8
MTLGQDSPVNRIFQDRTGHSRSDLERLLRTHGPIGERTAYEVHAAAEHLQDRHKALTSALATARQAMVTACLCAARGETVADITPLTGKVANLEALVDRYDDAVRRLRHMLGLACDTLTHPELTLRDRADLTGLVAAYRHACRTRNDSEHNAAHQLSDRVAALVQA